MGLGDTGGDRSDADFGHELDVNPSLRIRILQIVDELSQILDGVDVVVRRRRDQAHPGRGEANPGNPRIDLVARALAAATGLCPPGRLDLGAVGAYRVP